LLIVATEDFKYFYKLSNSHQYQISVFAPFFKLYYQLLID